MSVKQIRTTEPNDALIKQCERLLEDAKSGELQSMVGVVIYEQGNSSEFWVAAPKGYHLNLHSDRIIGCIERIKYQFLSNRYGIDAEDSWGSV